MSIALMQLCFRIEFPSPAMKLVALKLSDCANDEGENIYPSVGRVERETGLGQSTVRGVLKGFQDAGLLEVVAEASGNKWGRSTTVRRFMVERLHDLAAVEVKRGDRRVQEPSTHVLKQVGEGRDKVWTIAERGENDLSLYDTPEDTTVAPAPLQPPEGRQTAAPPATGPHPSSHWRGTPPATGPYPSVEPSVEPLPPTPAGGAGSAGEGEVRKLGLIEALRADGRNQHVVDHLIAPLLATLKPRFPDPIAALLAIRDRLRGHSQGELTAAREALGDVWVRDFPNQPACVEAVKAIQASRAAGVNVKRGTPQFSAWQEHFERTEPRGFHAKYMATSGQWPVPSEWPPGSRSQTTTEGATP